MKGHSAIFVLYSSIPQAAREFYKLTASALHVLVIHDVLDNVLGGDQLLRVLVGNLKSELVLDGHDDLDVVQAVQAEVVYEMGR